MTLNQGKRSERIKRCVCALLNAKEKIRLFFSYMKFKWKGKFLLFSDVVVRRAVQRGTHYSSSGSVCKCTLNGIMSVWLNIKSTKCKNAVQQE